MPKVGGGRHPNLSWRAWPNLGAATFVAQLQGSGSDCFITMGVLDTLMTMQDRGN